MRTYRTWKQKEITNEILNAIITITQKIMTDLFTTVITTVFHCFCAASVIVISFLLVAFFAAVADHLNEKYN